MNGRVFAMRFFDIYDVAVTCFRRGVQWFVGRVRIFQLVACFVLLSQEVLTRIGISSKVCCIYYTIPITMIPANPNALDSEYCRKKVFLSSLRHVRYLSIRLKFPHNYFRPPPQKHLRFINIYQIKQEVSSRI